MDRFEYDEFVPREVDLNDWHNIELGVNAQGDRTGWHLHDGPNLLLVDPHRLSTGIILQRIMLSAISRGQKVIHVDGGKRSGDLDRLLPWCVASPRGPQEAIQTLRLLRAELERRMSILEHELAGYWAFLSPRFRRVQNIKPFTVIIEGFESLTRQVTVPEWAEQILPDEAAKVRRVNRLRAEIIDHITTLAAHGRDQGIHVLVVVPAASVVPDELRTHFTTRMLVVNPRTFPAPSMLGDVFPRIDPDLTGEAREAAKEAAQPRGFALIASERDPLTLIQVALVRSSEVDGILKAIGAVKPKQWKLSPDDELPG